MGQEVVEPRLVDPSHLAGTAEGRGGAHGIWRPLRLIPSSSSPALRPRLYLRKPAGAAGEGYSLVIVAMLPSSLVMLTVNFSW